MTKQQGRLARIFSRTGNALARTELGRFQAAILAALFACVWTVIGLLVGYLLSFFVVYLAPDGRWSMHTANLIFLASLILCSGWGVFQGVRLYRAFSAALGRKSGD